MENVILAQRIADALTLRAISFEQKKMFGGICFLVDDKMLIGSNHDHKLLARIDPEEEEALLQRPGGVSVMVHGKRMAHGYLFVEPAGFESDADLSFWLEKCLAYNPKAKSSKKK